MKRSDGIGGSDVPAIWGCDPYGRTALDIWKQKVGEQAGPSGVGGIPPRYLDRGRRLEPIIADLFVEQVGFKVRRPTRRRVSREHPFMIGHLDRLIDNAGTYETDGILECKHVGDDLYKEIEETQEIPKHFRLQIEHYGIITGYRWGFVAVLNAHRWQFMALPWFANDRLIQSIVSIERAFWHMHVVPKVPPTLSEPDYPGAPIPEGRIIEIPDSQEHIRDALMDYVEAAESAKVATAEKNGALDALKTALKTPGVYEGFGVRIYYTQHDGRVRFDRASLAKVKPIDRNALALWLADRRSHDELAAGVQDGLLDLDLSTFEQQGEDYESLRIYPAKKQR